MHLTRRSFLTSLSASGLVLASPLRLVAAASGWRGYADAIVIDGLGFPGGSEGELGEALTRAHIEHVRRSGLTCTHLTVGPVGTMPSADAFEGVVRDIAYWDREAAQHPDVFARIRHTDDIRRAKQDGATGLVYGLQDGVAFESDLERLAVLHQFGVRIVQPTYNRRNLLGDGCMEPADAGLSRTGGEAVERLNELGMLVDLSHCGRRTAADAIDISRRPVAFTHTGCAALTDHPRHRTDAELRGVAETGGVTGIYVMPYLAAGRQPTAADVIRHLEHAIDVAGEEHVSIGTDGTVSPTELTAGFIESFREKTRWRREAGIAAPGETEEGYLFANDLNTPRRFETLAALLLERGHSERRIEKLLGANLLRVFAEAWS